MDSTQKHLSIPGLVPEASPVVLVRISGVMSAFPVDAVVETMRPLATSPLAGMPEFLRGIALVRGVPTPVIDLGALFDGLPCAATRLLILRTAGRTVAVLVEAVLGIVQMDRLSFGDLPPIIQNARPDVIEAIGRMDSELLVTFRLGRLVPDGVWQSIATASGQQSL